MSMRRWGAREAVCGPADIWYPNLLPSQQFWVQLSWEITHSLPSSEPLPVNRLQPRLLEDTKIEVMYKNKKFSLTFFWKLRRNFIN